MSDARCLQLLPNESWYGGVIDDGWKMPFQEGFNRHLVREIHGNQEQPLLVSSKGRWVWSEAPFRCRIADSQLHLDETECELITGEGHTDLRGACRAAQQRFFPASGAMPAAELFTRPQYNTWIELMYDQAQAPILAYAERLVAEGYPTGVLMIDDTWQLNYGVWDFNVGRFPDAKGLIKKLHDMGFQVMLWVCPLISPDSAAFREARDAQLIIRNAAGEPAIRSWWNGYSAALDMTNPEARAWLRAQLQKLHDDYGVDGFKFDAGDPYCYRDDDLVCEPGHPGTQGEAWARFGLGWPLNEFRYCWRMGGQAVGQRLRDKLHSWDEFGLGSCVPNALAMGLVGYPFVCPDMIGGGEYLHFRTHQDCLDHELVVRYAQASALMPMMQFSAAPWRVLPAEHNALCLAAAQLHVTYGALIQQLAHHAATTGEPIMRHLAWAYPDHGYEGISDQFLLGEKVLVAPVTIKDQRQRTVHIPPGTWIADDGATYVGPSNHIIATPLARLPYFSLKE